eukprot:2019355-Amphidinium_carterae.2
MHFAAMTGELCAVEAQSQLTPPNKETCRETLMRGVCWSLRPHATGLASRWLLGPLAGAWLWGSGALP